MRSKHKISVLFFMAALLAASVPLQARARREKLNRQGEAGSPQSVPLKIYRNFWVIAEGQFGTSAERQNFVVDTGTAPSIVNAALVGQLGLGTVSSTSLMAGKILATQAGIVPEIDLGPIRAVSVSVQVQDLSWLERDLGIPIGGVIGMDVLSRSSFRLDYNAREIEFGDISRVGIPVPFDALAGLAVAEVRFRGRALRMLLDTGTDRVVLLGGNFADPGWLSLRNTSQFGSSLAEQGVPIQVFSAPDIELGGQHFSEERAYFVPERSDPQFDGLLGVLALGFRVLSYDRASKTMYLQK